MSDPKGSWTKNYEEVDFDVPLFQSPLYEGDAMLQSPSTPKNLSTSSTPEPQTLDSSSILLALPRPAKHHLSHTHGPLTHEASSSNPPPTIIDSTTVGNPTPDFPFSSSNSGNFHPRSQRTTVSSIKSFASSPLKPSGTSGPTSFPSSPFNRSGSRTSAYINRIASEECRALASHQAVNHSGSRGSMILYRCADLTPDDGLLPPTRSHLHRNSILSVSGDSIVSLSSDSKYPARTIGSERGLIAYAYDPSLDELGSATPADDDFLHDPDEKLPQRPGLFPSVSFRGAINILALVALIAALLCLFVVYPVIRFYHDNGRNLLITFNTRINKTGQAEMVIVNRRSQIFFATPVPLLDPSTPLPARMLKTAQNIAYELVFSDEFTQNDRSFSADQDPIWETASASDVHDSSLINTKNGRLRASLDTLQGQAQDRHRHRYQYNNNRCTETRVRGSGWGSWRGEDGERERSGIYTDMGSSGVLKMKVPFCLSRGGFVEVGLGEGVRTWTGSGLKKGIERKAEEDEGTLRRLIYWPGSSDSWSSLNQSETPNVPADVLSTLTDSNSRTSLALSIGIPIDDVGDFGSADKRRRRSRSKEVEIEVDYVRIYQPAESSPMVTEEAIWECAAARKDVMLDVLEEPNRPTPSV